ncbi:MAG: nitrate ABC transporter substrate-binding protein, partial [Myxococcota bacterium]|nr:nitrate ABC transporter substrate-binding protein [Myxococcota bacterium]
MPRHVSAGLGLLVVGVLGLVGFYFLRPTLEDWQQRMSSDASASAGTVRIGTDSWVGYFPLCSPVMRARMRDQGYRLRCEDDAADYPARMRALREGDLELAVATVDSYLQNGAAERFPANIVAVIDESKGGDAIVARKEKVPDIDALKAAADPKVAFTPASPSEHLLRAVASHFDIPLLLEQQGAWRVETNGSEEARRKLESGAVDVAVLWEPDSSLRRASSEPLVSTRQAPCCSSRSGMSKWLATARSR